MTNRESYVRNNLLSNVSTMPPDFKTQIYPEAELVSRNVPQLYERIAHVLTRYAVISEMLSLHATSCEGPETASSLNIRVSGAMTASEFPDYNKLYEGEFRELSSEIMNEQMYVGEELAHRAVLLFQLPNNCWTFRTPRKGQVQATEMHTDTNDLAANYYPFGAGPLIISRTKGKRSRREVFSNYIRITPRPHDLVLSTLQEYTHGAADIPMDLKDARALVREGLTLDDAVADQLPLGRVLSPDVDMLQLLLRGGARFTMAKNYYKEGGEEKRDILDPEFSLDEHLSGKRHPLIS